jgi:poly-gamma-glutamate capsule biosynthesis protein CapA/YwtB (metallophosphatase superfamily)
MAPMGSLQEYLYSAARCASPHMRATNVLLSVLFLAIFFLTSTLTFYMFRQEKGINSFWPVTDLFNKTPIALDLDESSLTTDPATGVVQRAGLLSDSIDLIFVGDVMLDRHIRLNARNRSQEFIFSDLSGLLRSADLVVANLEGPVTTNVSVSEGSAVGSPNNFRFTFDPSWVQTLISQNITVVSLGNNHIWDFGADGILQTKQYLDDGGISYFGAISAQDQTDRWLLLELKGMKIALVNYNEFIPGGFQAALDDIAAARLAADLVVLYTHWGAEYQTTANQTIQTQAHRFVDEGADVIIGSHPHVIQQKEEYKGKIIYYSLGNFIFDQYFSDDVRKGLVVRMTIDPVSGRLNFREYQTWLEKDGRTILLDEGSDAGSADLVRS